MTRKSLNHTVLLVFAPALILIGILGFALPAGTSPTSGEPAYNIFHIASGIIGLLLVLKRYENFIRAFNIGFGLIDLYQAAASYLHVFPEQYFKWTKVDDVLHVVIGAILAVVGLYGFKKPYQKN